MARKLRYIPEGGALVEVTCRTLHGRLLLRPSRELNEILGGVLGRSNQPRSEALGYVPGALAGFLRHAGAEGWRTGPAPSGVEGRSPGLQTWALVESPEDWPGIHCVRELLGGEPLTGYWFNRTQEYAARRRREEHDRYEYATLETVTLSPLPCWEHLPEEEYRKRIERQVASIKAETATRRKRTGAEPLGPEAILAQHPHSRPKKIKRSPAPRFHAATKDRRRELYEGYAWFVAAFRTAAEKLKAGDPAPPFPRGCFPPALPFVGWE